MTYLNEHLFIIDKNMRLVNSEVEFIADDATRIEIHLRHD